MTSSRSMLLTGLAAMLMTLPSQAQPRGGGPGGPGGGTPSKHLPLSGALRVEAVREALELMPDQVEALEKLAQRGREGDRERPDFRNMSEDERREFMTKMQKERETRTVEANEMLEQVLLPPQLDRLREIAIQMAGVGALFSDFVGDELQLSDKQREKLKTVQEESAEKVREQMRSMFSGQGRRGEEGEARNGERGERGGFDRDAMRKKMEDMRAGIESDVMGVLTSEQRSQFDKLKGEKFDMPARQFGGGRSGDAQRGRGSREGGDRGSRRPEPRGDREDSKEKE